MKKTLLVPAIAIAIAAPLAAWFVLNPPKPAPMPQPAATEETAPQQPQEKLYHNADWNFTLRYADPVRLILDKQEMAASGYIPVCDPEKAVACLIVPKEMYDGTNFDGAGLAVDILPDMATEKTCLAEDGNARQVDVQTIGGVKFTVFNDGDAAMSHRSQGQDYRAFRNGTCFELATRTYTTVFEVYQAGTIKEYTSADQEITQALLRKMAEAFRFE